MIVKYVRQLPKTRNRNLNLEKKIEQQVIENLETAPLVLKKIPENDYFYPLAIEITQRYGMVEFENFFSKIKK